MDFVLAGGGPASGSGSNLGHENGPTLFTEPNRTSAVDDLRSVVIYVFIVTIFVGFFLILPGIRNEKFPTFLCVTTSLVVTSIILVALLGTSWHVGQASIAAPYKAHSMDRIQGLLRVKVGLSSVNITLQAHKYYQLHQRAAGAGATSAATTTTATSVPISASAANLSLANNSSTSPQNTHNLAEELLEERTADGTSVDAELEVDEEAFPSASPSSPSSRAPRAPRAAPRLSDLRAPNSDDDHFKMDEQSNVDINYNERFYWIEPQQMRQEHHQALERGLPYPILTVVEYLSQDEAGFSWSRQYRSAGYYSHILLWLGLCLCALMFFLHCATPKYGIYAMQLLGALLLFTNFTYSLLVPRGDQRLVIPFEGQSLELRFGWNFWLVFIGGCLSLSVGTLIVAIDSLFPNYIFTTILDVDFDSHTKYSKYYASNNGQQLGPLERPARPPFIKSPPAERVNEAFRDDESQPSASSSPRNSATGFSSHTTSEMHQRKPAKRDQAPEMEANRSAPTGKLAANGHHYGQTKSADQRQRYEFGEHPAGTNAANDVRL